jgi:agmatinase
MSQPKFDPDSPATGGGIYGLPHAPDEAAVVIIPIPWEATVSYRAGTAQGPAAVLAASRQVDLFDLETGKPYEAGIALLPEDPQVVEWNKTARELAAPIIAAGGAEGSAQMQKYLREVNRLGESLNAWVYEETKKWLARGKLIGLLGGDHSAPFGGIRAIAEAHPGLGILHFDAHADLRNAYEGFTWSHASIMHNVMEKIPQAGKLVQAGIRDFGAAEYQYIQSRPEKIKTFFDGELRRRQFAGESFTKLADEIIASLPGEVYLSFDIDGLNPAFCPHTGTPVPGGLEFTEACFLMRRVAESGRKIVGFDLNEVAPGPEGDEWDANVGARLLYKMIGFALMNRVGDRG